MSKIKTEVYQCDKCEEKFFEPEDVFDVDGVLKDGSGEIIISDSMLCPDCFLELAYRNRDILDPIVNISEQIQDEIAINEEKEEEDNGQVDSDPFDDEDFE